MSTIIAYPVTPDMGTREAINAMLSHVAYDQSMGYNAPAMFASNYRRILEDWGHFVEGAYVSHTSQLRLVAKVPHEDSAGNLVEFVDMLIGLCNDYPAYDDEDMSRIENDRALEYVQECLDQDDNTTAEAWRVLQAMFELGLYIEHESDGGVYISETDFTSALEYALTVESN